VRGGGIFKKSQKSTDFEMAVGKNAKNGTF